MEPPADADAPLKKPEEPLGFEREPSSQSLGHLMRGEPAGKALMDANLRNDGTTCTTDVIL
jgi:hypothetical protein